MAKSLPARPHLEQLKKQAKELLKNYKTNNGETETETETLARVRAHTPRLAGKSDAEIAKERFVLQDAQHVLAREYGFSAWDAMVMAIKPTIEVLVHLTDREAQIYLREVDQKDLVVGLSGASEAVREKFLHNMSTRVRTFIREEMEHLEPLDAEDVNSVQLRMIAQVVQLSERGHIQWPPQPPNKRKKGASAIKKEKPDKVAQEQAARIARMGEKKLHELSYEEINQLFVDLAETARREGILAMEAAGNSMADDYIKTAVSLAVDGTEPALIMDMLETWKKSLMHEQETKYIKVIEGIMAIQAGDNPRIIEHKLSLIF
ncbi:MAG: hypothetical protein ACI906_003094 [Candidatus Latescibacterota bacterium]|jgi:hypothetical protein